MVKSLIHEPSRLNSNVPIWLANDRANEKDNPKIPKVPRKKKIIKIEENFDVTENWLFLTNKKFFDFEL